MKTPIDQALHDMDYYQTMLGLTKTQKTLIKEWLETYLPAQRQAIEGAYKDGAEHQSNYGDIPGRKEPDSEKYFNDKYDE